MGWHCQQGRWSDDGGRHAARPRPTVTVQSQTSALELSELLFDFVVLHA